MSNLSGCHADERSVPARTAIDRFNYGNTRPVICINHSDAVHTHWRAQMAGKDGSING